MHNRLTANDFFTYELHRQSQLHGLVNNEFMTLWEDSVLELEWDRWLQVSEVIRTGDHNDAQKQELLQLACRPVGRAERVEPNPDRWEPGED